MAERFEGLGVGEVGLVGEDLEVGGDDGEDEVAAAGEGVEVDDVGLVFRAAQELVGGDVEERLVDVEQGLRDVDLDDGGDGAGEAGDVDVLGLEAHGGEVDLLGAGGGVEA